VGKQWKEWQGGGRSGKAEGRGRRGGDGEKGTEERGLLATPPNLPLSSPFSLFS